MDKLHDILPVLAQYNAAFACLAMLCLITLIQNFLTAPLAFASNKQTPGMPLQHDYSDLSFRVVRTYQNSTETLPAFGFALLAAIFVGVSAFWVNLLAGFYVGFRLLFWVIYYGGIGKVAGGPRSIAFVGSLVTNITLACMAVYQTIQHL